MKKYYIFLLIAINFGLYSQSPAPLINYQGVARTSGGIPIIGTIGINLNLHQGSAAGAVIFTEPHSAATNSFGIFNLQIGSSNTSGFSAIDWSQGPYFLEVSIDPNGGTSYTSIGIQQLVSVPYALYAEKAKNASTTSISATPNITVTNLGVNNFSLASPNYVAGANVTITAGPSNNYTISADSAAGGPWTNNLTSVFLVNNANTVGIGTLTPIAKLEVNTGTVASMDAIFAGSSSGNGVVGTVASSGTNIAGTKGMNGGVGPGIFGGNNSGGTGVYGENVSGSASANANGVNGRTNSQGATASGVLGENYGGGPGVYGFQGNNSAGANASGVLGVSNTSLASGVQGISNGGNAGVAGIITSAPNSPNANGVYGKTNSTSGAAAGVRGDNMTFNGGNGVYGTTNSSVSAGVYGENYGFGTGIYGKTSSTNSSIVTAGVQGNHYGFGYGVYGISTSTLNYYSGVYGNNTGGGVGVLGTTNSSDPVASGVYGLNNGNGPGVRAGVPTFTSAGSVNLSLLLENGHVKSTQPNPPIVSTFSATGGATSVSYTVANCTDVKGSLLAVCTTTGMINIGGLVIIKVSFIKPYILSPTVVITPTSDFGGMSYYISGVTPTYFYVTLKNNTAVNIPGNPLSFNFNYFVIE